MKISPQQHSMNKKKSNVAKHLRIAQATKGEERQKHLERADKLLTKYGM